MTPNGDAKKEVSFAPQSENPPPPMPVDPEESDNESWPSPPPPEVMDPEELDDDEENKRPREYVVYDEDGNPYNEVLTYL